MQPEMFVQNEYELWPHQLGRFDKINKRGIAMFKEKFLYGIFLTLLLLSPTLTFALGNAGHNLTFDGINDIAIVPNNELLNSLAEEYTIEAWVNLSTYMNRPRIVDRDHVFSLYVDAIGGNHVEFFSYKNVAVVVKSAVISSDVWHHVAVRRQKVGLNYVTGLFIDGLPSGATSTSADLSLLAGNTPLTLGNTLAAGMVLARPWKGQLDEVRLWKIARNDAEIAANRGVSLTGSEIGLLADYELNEASGQIFYDKSPNLLSGSLGMIPHNVAVNDPAWSPSNAPIGLNLLSPNTGTMNIGDPLTITWVADPALTYVNVLFSVDGGTSWMYLAYGAANNGTLSTYVPGYPTTQALFRVADPVNAARFDDSDAAVTFNSVGAWQKTVTKEAEDAVITKAMHINWDGHAFGCTFIYTSHNNSGTADLSITVPSNGIYALWGRSRSKGSTRNSFFVSVDSGDQYIWDTEKNDTWNWDKISHRGAGIAGETAEIDPLLFKLTAGDHTIRFSGRENYTRLDRIRLTNDLTASYWDEPNEWVELVNPPDGEDGGIVVRGTDYLITWKSQNISRKVTIEFSKDDRFFASPVLIARGTDNDGSYLWHVPDDSVDDAFIRISDGNGGSCPMDQTWDAFTIINPPPQITVTAPNGGEKWNVNSTHELAWNSAYFSGTVNLEYSLNKGKNWTTIAVNRPATGTFAWVVPNTPSDSCLVRVADSADAIPTDVSDNVFSIIPTTPQPSGDYALSFDGLNDYVDVANDASLNVSKKFTIEFWLKTASPMQNYGRILEKGSWDEYYMGFYSTSGKMSGALRVASGTSTRMDIPIGPSKTIIAANNWYHFAATYDGSVAKLYVNGQLESSKPATASPRSLAGDLIIGAVKRITGIESPLKGVLDELSIWNIARSNIEIFTALFVPLTGNEPGLVAYYNFNEGTGQVLGDLTTYHNDGLLGATVAADDADPVWVASDRPTSFISAFDAGTLAKNSAEVEANFPEEFRLAQNYPNPFNAGTTIVYDIPKMNETTMSVTLTIYDVQGQLIRTLSGPSEPGSHQIHWDGAAESGASVSSGIYFYRLDAGSFSESKRMVMIK
jgi:hypothetical protein